MYRFGACFASFMGLKQKATGRLWSLPRAILVYMGESHSNICSTICEKKEESSVRSGQVGERKRANFCTHWKRSRCQTKAGFLEGRLLFGICREEEKRSLGE